MAPPRRSFLRSCVLPLLAAVLLASPSVLQVIAADLDPSAWVVTNAAKDLELHGSVSQAISKYSVKQASASPGPFFIALDASEYEKVNFIDAVLEQEGQMSLLQTTDEGLDMEDHSTRLLSVVLPAGNGDDAINFQLRASYNHLVEPLPKVIGQSDKQFLLWEGDVSIRTPYKTDKGRVKITTSTPNVLNYSPKDEHATKSSNKVTFGPYERIQSYRTSPVKRGSVHYEHNLPMVSVVNLERVAEISHWGDNLAIEDRIWLRNDGPALKGHFSRIEHQKTAYMQQATTHVLSRFPMALPPGARDPYFIDQIGNVSTSRFHSSPPAPDSINTPPHLLPKGYASAIEIQPRYPVLGGWNYTFSLGWNHKLGKGGWGKSLSGGVNSVAVPFLTAVGDAFAIDNVKTTIVLPEGATHISTYLPFAVDSMNEQIYTTYLDTTGRPSIVLEKSHCSEKHSQLVYIQYRLSPLAHLRKPLAVTMVTLGVFTLAAALRRFDPKITA